VGLTPAPQTALRESMIPKKPVPDTIRDGNRFSEKIMLKQEASA